MSTAQSTVLRQRRRAFLTLRQTGPLPTAGVHFVSNLLFASSLYSGSADEVPHSLGHSAIFLLGSSSRNDPPTPMILRSGDLLIMSGRGRQSYHG